MSQYFEFDDEFASPTDYALQYRQIGLQVVPAYNPSEITEWKRPALKQWKSLSREHMTDVEFETLYGAKGTHIRRKNMGILTGRCSYGVFILDLDTHKKDHARIWLDGLLQENNNGKPLETPTQTTGGGGKQLLFRAPAHWVAPTSKRSDLGIDIRGEGGFAMMPPSMHESGKCYEWDDDLAPWQVPIIEAPEWLLSEIDKIFPPTNRPAEQSRPKHQNNDVGSSSADSYEDAFGRLVDGREGYMMRLVCARLVDLHRMGRPKPDEGQLTAIKEDLWAQFESKVKSRIQKQGIAKRDLLEMEGRGPSLMLKKLNYLAQNWDTKVAEMASKPSNDSLYTSANNYFLHDQDNNVGPATQGYSPDIIMSDIEPADLWGSFLPPSLPEDILPQSIEKYALIQSEHMGVDAGGLAMAAITTCAAAISDSIKLQVKEHDKNWTESARIWTTLVGEPSTKKSPIISQAVKPLRFIDRNMHHEHVEELKNWETLNKGQNEAPPKPTEKRIIIEDITMEAAQEILKNNPSGLLCYQDELSGFFGSMDKYSGSKGAAKDRAFWLQSYNGGEYRVSRINRGSIFICNLSVCLLGGIQPDPIRKLSADCHDDGLLQRFFPIVLGPARLGQDAPRPDVVGVYDDLVLKLFEINPPVNRFTGEIIPIHLSPEAQAIRRALEVKHFHLQSMEIVNKKLAAHIGKYDGLFARLCLIFHCIENVDKDPIPDIVSADLAQRVADFLHKFLFAHALAFYGGVLRLASDYDQLVDVAGYILAHGLEHITPRDLQRSITSMKNFDRQSRERICEQFEALGWLYQNPVPGPNRTSHRWLVNPRVHQLFAAKAEQEKRRRESVRKIFADLSANKVA